MTNVICLEYISTENQFADFFTKPLPAIKFIELRNVGTRFADTKWNLISLFIYFVCSIFNLNVFVNINLSSDLIGFSPYPCSGMLDHFTTSRMHTTDRHKNKWIIIYKCYFLRGVLEYPYFLNHWPL